MGGRRLIIKIYYAEETIPKANGVNNDWKWPIFPQYSITKEVQKEALKTANKQEAGVFDEWAVGDRETGVMNKSIVSKDKHMVIR